MSLSVNFSQTSVSTQYLFASSGQVANNPVPTEPKAEHHRQRVRSDDQVTLSSEAAQTSQSSRVRHHREHDDDNPMSELDKLVSKLVRTMLKSMLGQGFQLLEPGKTGTQPAAVEVPATQQADVSTPATGSSEPGAVATTTADTGATNNTPAPTTNLPAGPFSNAVATYYEVQSFSFDFSGAVNTEDGQQVGLSVHFSFSQQFFAAVGGMAGSGVNNGPAAADQAQQPGSAPPVTGQFQGLAAQLTQTEFSFEVDLNGQPADDTSAAAPASSQAVALAPVGQTDDQRQEGLSSLLEQLDKLFERMQVWLKHPEGGRQLVAVGMNRNTAMYVGNLTQPEPNPSPSATQPAAVIGTDADQTSSEAVNVVA